MSDYPDRVWCSVNSGYWYDANRTVDGVEYIRADLANAPAIPQQPIPSFAHRLAGFLNSINREIRSNTPDFLLAEFVDSVLTAAEVLIVNRDHWYRPDPSPCGGDHDPNGNEDALLREKPKPKPEPRVWESEVRLIRGRTKLVAIIEPPLDWKPGTKVRIEEVLPE